MCVLLLYDVRCTAGRVIGGFQYCFAGSVPAEGLQLVTFPQWRTLLPTTVLAAPSSQILGARAIMCEISDCQAVPFYCKLTS